MRRPNVWCRILGATVVFLTPQASRAADVTLWRPPPQPRDALPVECIKDVTYFKGQPADAYRHRLDLYIPKGRKNFPVVVLVHGGSWMLGDNRCCGLYSSIGEFLASRGIGAVLPNYRLSPWVKHPEHVKDVARAVAWTKAHIAEHGGRPDRIFLLGHSAGGHLVSLLASDERYLKAEGLTTGDIKGVIAVSGVYRIPAGDYQFSLGGTGADGLRLSDLVSMRGKGGLGPTAAVGLPMHLNVFGPVFGDDPPSRADASPVNHVRRGLPPFLLFAAEHDLPGLPAMADEFQRALLAKGCTSRFETVKDRNHNSVMFLAIEPTDPVAKSIVDFVR